MDLSRRGSRAECLGAFSPRKSRASRPAPAQFTRPSYPRQASPLPGSPATWPAPEKHPCTGTLGCSRGVSKKTGACKTPYGQVWNEGHLAPGTPGRSSCQDSAAGLLELPRSREIPRDPTRFGSLCKVGAPAPQAWSRQPQGLSCRRAHCRAPAPAAPQDPHLLAPHTRKWGTSIHAQPLRRPVCFPEKPHAPPIRPGSWPRP